MSDHPPLTIFWYVIGSNIDLYKFQTGPNSLVQVPPGQVAQPQPQQPSDGQQQNFYSHPATPLPPPAATPSPAIQLAVAPGQQVLRAGGGAMSVPAQMSVGGMGVAGMGGVTGQLVTLPNGQQAVVRSPAPQLVQLSQPVQQLVSVQIPMTNANGQTVYQTVQIPVGGKHLYSC